MKKGIIKIVTTLAFAFMMMISVTSTMNETDISLMGIQALASGSTGCPSTCNSPGYACDPPQGECFAAFNYICVGPGGELPCERSCWCGDDD
jgi:hypothetical protein